MIQTFIRMREAGGFEGWEYHIVGNITQVPGAREYASGLVDLAEGHPIYFHFDAPAAELTDLLRCGSLFWHATGFGEDPEREPEKLEHFGISTVEAMAYGLVPIVISMGGQPELVRDGENGYLWRSLAELESRTRELASDPNQREQMADRAYLRSQDFGREVFKRRARELVHRIAPIKAANPSD
jgi:glycosyltransferase involved in cell wall biosynthesis